MMCGWEGAEEEKEEKTGRCFPKVIREETHSQRTARPLLATPSCHPLPPQLPLHPSLYERMIKTCNLASEMLPPTPVRDSPIGNIFLKDPLCAGTVLVLWGHHRSIYSPVCALLLDFCQESISGFGGFCGTYDLNT